MIINTTLQLHLKNIVTLCAVLHDDVEYFKRNKKFLDESVLISQKYRMTHRKIIMSAKEIEKALVESRTAPMEEEPTIKLISLLSEAEKKQRTITGLTIQETDALLSDADKIIDTEDFIETLVQNILNAHETKNTTDLNGYIENATQDFANIAKSIRVLLGIDAYTVAPNTATITPAKA